MDKQIAAVKQQSSTQVYVYDERGSYMFALNGQLVGYTASTVSVKQSTGQVYVYDNKGHYKFAK